MPFAYPPPSAYDLDVQPPPRMVVEVTSPSSQANDKETKVDFYASLGIETYLVIDAVTADSQLRHPIDLYLWRLRNGQPQAVLPDARGGFALPEIGLRIWVAGQRIRFADLATDQVLVDMDQTIHERDAAARARDEAVYERDEATRVRDEAVSERDEERRAREAAEARRRRGAPQRA